MYQQTVLKGTQIGREVAYRDPNALFSLVGTDGNGKNAYLPSGRTCSAAICCCWEAPVQERAT